MKTNNLDGALEHAEIERIEYENSQTDLRRALFEKISAVDKQWDNVSSVAKVKKMDGAQTSAYYILAGRKELGEEIGGLLGKY